MARPVGFTSASAYVPPKIETGVITADFFSTPPQAVKDAASVKKITQLGQKGIADSLRDPNSAQFRASSVFKINPDDFLLCTEVNGKNAYGGYVGFDLAVARIRGGATSGTYVATNDTEYGANVGSMAAIRAVCQQGPTTLSGAPLDMGKAAMTDLKRDLGL
jgi:hypothetical protein